MALTAPFPLLTLLLQGLSCLGSLHTLLLADNHLCSLESLQHLAECKGLVELDLSHNQISDIGRG